MKLTLDTIKQTLAHHNPKRMIHPDMKSAAVLVPLVQHTTELQLLLTKRTDSVEHHKGQISFPGGMTDSSDTTAVETALRETEEELGIPPSFISILGSIDDIRIPTGFVVTPVVGYIASLPPFHINADEVAVAFEIPMHNFFNPSFFRSEMRMLGGMERQVYFYDVWKEPVWGATAAIIKQFTELLSAAAR